MWSTFNITLSTSSPVTPSLFHCVHKTQKNVKKKGKGFPILDTERWACHYFPPGLRLPP